MASSWFGTPTPCHRDCLFPAKEIQDRNILGIGAWDLCPSWEKGRPYIYKRLERLGARHGWIDMVKLVGRESPGHGALSNITIYLSHIFDMNLGQYQDYKGHSFHCWNWFNQNPLIEYLFILSSRHFPWAPPHLQQFCLPFRQGHSLQSPRRWRLRRLGHPMGVGSGETGTRLFESDL